MISATKRRSSRRGFTFIELMVVIIIIAVLTSISAPLFKNTFAEIQLNQTLRQLQTFIGFLHQRSVIERKVIYLKVDNQQKQYWGQINDRPARLRSYSFPEKFILDVKKLQTHRINLFLFTLTGQLMRLLLRYQHLRGEVYL